MLDIQLILIVIISVISIWVGILHIEKHNKHNERMKSILDGELYEQ